FTGFTKANDKGSFVKGTVKSADATGILVYATIKANKDTEVSD
ncbi:MAG: hypothetical protein RLZZ625_153, partial [Pseudomonadota bacterium]